MKITLNWLKDYLNTTATVEEIADTLVQLGHEIDGIESTTPVFNNVVVGYVKERVQHPDADKLGVCQVDVGAENGGTLQIVCGASNAREGIHVAVALPKAVLPGDFKIKKSKIRGVESNGMICSVRELGLGDDHEGIWELETSLSTGTPLNEYLPESDTIIDVAVTPNRGDALGVYGIARDLAAAGVGELKAWDEITVAQSGAGAKVVTETEGCSLFTGICVSNLKNTQSPDWMKARLMAAGLQPKSALVDITNYVMLTTGKPIHAYDADKVKGTLRAQNAKGGEVFKGLGGTTVTLNQGDVVIVDDSGVVGLGGILGGTSTCVDDETTNVIIESANFDKSRIAVTGQSHQILTDARYRFERGVDHNTTAYAGLLAAQLMHQICGGSIGTQTISGQSQITGQVISFSPNFVSTFGGLNVDEETIQTILESLGFSIEVESESHWKVTAPTFRTFMENPEDLVEEVLRVIGYDAVPAQLLPTPEQSLTKLAPQLELDKKARRELAAQGFMETITYSFISQPKAELFSQGKPLFTVANPIDEETMTTMRPSLLPGLLDAVSQNTARSTLTPKLAEVGKVFTQEKEEIMAAAVLTQDQTRHWQGKQEAPDAFTAKEEALKLLSVLGAPMDKLQVEQGAPSVYHPGRSGTLRLGKQAYAYFGEIHPKIAKVFDLKGQVVAFEVFIEPLAKMNNKVKPFVTSAFQSTEKDMAFIMPIEVAAEEVLRAARKAAGDFCQEVRIFDVYEGDKLPENQKSLAITIKLQASDKTLTESDIQNSMSATVSAIEKQFAAQLRGEI